MRIDSGGTVGLWSGVWSQTKLDHDYNMGVAINTAKLSHQLGGAPIGAALVRRLTGEVVAIGKSFVGPSHDPTAHAEVNCLRMASGALKTDQMPEYVLYSTLEPCHMCLSACAWAHIYEVYFGASRYDVDRSSLFDIKGDFDIKLESSRLNTHSHNRMRLGGGVRLSECVELLDLLPEEAYG